MAKALEEAQIAGEEPELVTESPGRHNFADVRCYVMIDPPPPSLFLSLSLIVGLDTTDTVSDADIEDAAVTDVLTDAEPGRAAILSNHSKLSLIILNIAEGVSASATVKATNVRQEAAAHTVPLPTTTSDVPPSALSQLTAESLIPGTDSFLTLEEGKSEPHESHVILWDATHSLQGFFSKSHSYRGATRALSRSYS